MLDCVMQAAIRSDSLSPNIVLNAIGNIIAKTIAAKPRKIHLVSLSTECELAIIPTHDHFQQQGGSNGNFAKLLFLDPRQPVLLGLASWVTQLDDQDQEAANSFHSVCRSFRAVHHQLCET